MLRMRQTHGSRFRAALGVVLFAAILMAPSLRVEGASSIAQGFEAADNNIVSGALVGLKAGTANTVELATLERLDGLLGVAGENSLIELSGSAAGTVQVVTSGEAAALVSDINGAVKTGDKITASPIAGVGMKAVTSTLIIGTAQASLNGSTVETRTIKDKNGKEQTVKIGLVPLQVDKVFYEVPQDTSTFVPPALQDFATSVAGRTVSPVRIIIAAFLALLLFVVIAVLLYSAVRSSIISIGRNPLSQSAVRSSLFQVGLTVLGIMAFTVVIIYLILIT